MCALHLSLSLHQTFCICVPVWHSAGSASTFARAQRGSQETTSHQQCKPLFSDRCLCQGCSGAAARPTMASHDIKGLRKQLKTLQREKLALEREQSRQQVPATLALQMQAVLILLLSGSAALACTWVEQQQRARPYHTHKTYAAVTATMVEAWCRQWAAHGLVAAAMQDLSHPWRAAVDMFLVESLLAERIARMTASGMAVSAACVWESFQRYWSFRPQTPRQQAWLASMEGKANCRAKYLWRFRRRWGLQLGLPAVRPGLSVALLQDRAASLLNMLLLHFQSSNSVSSCFGLCALYSSAHLIHLDI